MDLLMSVGFVSGLALHNFNHIICTMPVLLALVIQATSMIEGLVVGLPQMGN